MTIVYKYNERQDKFGYYTVDNLKFYSKFDAMLAEQRTGNALKWNFNDHIYSSYNWSQEPTDSIDELYRQRAQQLRDQYDYLVLWFSGGADSANILNAFIEHDIKLDEVVSWTNLDATGDRENSLNAEIFNFATVLADRAKQKQPNLKHRIVDISRSTMEFYSQNDNKFDWMYYASAHYSPNTLARQNIALTVRDWTEMFTAGKKVGFIYGIEKPSVSEFNGQFYFKFSDMCIDVANSSIIQILDRPWEFNELFYWSPDCPEIVIKQAHLIKRYLTTTRNVSEYEPRKSMTAAPVQTVIDKNISFMRNDVMHRIIYPWWEPNPWQYKSPSNIVSIKDNWFFDQTDNEQSKRVWKMGIEELWRRTPDKWKYDPADVSKGIRSCLSPIYKL